MSRFFLEGVWGPDGIRRTPAEVAAMLDDHERIMLDYELDVMTADLRPVLEGIDAL